MTTIKEAKRACSLKKWAHIIKDCQASALTQAEYFEKNNISKSPYYYWQRIVRLKMLEDQDRPSARSSSTPQFSEVDVTTGKADENRLLLRYHGFELEITESTSPSLLRKTLDALKSVSL